MVKLKFHSKNHESWLLQLFVSYRRPGHLASHKSPHLEPRNRLGTDKHWVCTQEVKGKLTFLLSAGTSSLISLSGLHSNSGELRIGIKLPALDFGYISHCLLLNICTQSATANSFFCAVFGVTCQVLNLFYYHQFYWIGNFVLPSQDDLTPLHREEGRQIRVGEPERLYPGLQETKHVEFVTESEQFICPCRGAVMCSHGKPETKIITHVIKRKDCCIDKTFTLRLSTAYLRMSFSAGDT